MDSLEDTKSLTDRSWAIEGEPEKMDNRRWKGRHELFAEKYSQCHTC